MYFTSWDANVFLCLLSVFPDEIVRGMIKLVKQTHEEFVRTETQDYHCNLARHLLYLNKMYFPPMAIQQLKQMWKWRSPERRRNNVVKWVKYEYDWNLRRVSRTDYWNYAPIPSENPGKATSRAGYWNSSETWSYSILDRNLDTSGWSEDEEEEYFNMKQKSRKKYIGDWYNNIHEGRYFLFFKEHDILDSKVYDNYRHQDKKRGSLNSVISICALGSRAQVAQDLLTIDGGGLGQKPCNHVEHINDLFP